MSREHATELLERMVLIRRFEEKCAEQYSAGKIRGFLHLYVGEEAVAVGALASLRPDDNVVATYREHGHALIRGISPSAVMAEMYGKATGCARGRGGSMHLFSDAGRLFGGNAIVAGGLPIACGLALADLMSKREAVTACFFGDGATDEGAYHEALNLASLWKLPVLFLCENNLYAMGTALERHAAETDLTRIPAAHRIPSEAVDGMDVAAIERTVRYAADLVRDGAGPRFLELRTYRFRAHSMYDAERYRSKDEVAKWMERDPITMFERRLRQQGLIDDTLISQIEERVANVVAAAVDAAEEAPLEPVSNLCRDLYARAPT
ncbi:MAG: pyruvate dehydrogenase (acetyl-transferring) E1 component subunit alpha [Polyangiaceae bacterium]|nr:pyruvate dehydrogenase (acetyl-transferring) E1 component subunit alpha [Polyangiaceae bacterium]